MQFTQLVQNMIFPIGFTWFSILFIAFLQFLGSELLYNLNIKNIYSNFETEVILGGGGEVMKPSEAMTSVRSPI